MRRLRVGRQSAAFLRRGHPWLRPDRFTGSLAGLVPGDAVTLCDDSDRPIASALVDPGQPICARVYHRRPDKRFDPAVALRRAWDRRAALHSDPTTNCYRLVHGEADHLPGLRIERYDDQVVVLIQSRAMLPHLPAVLQALQELLPAATVYIREHLDDLRREPAATRRADGTACDPALTITGLERDCRVAIRPAAGLATGIYVDQRATRDWLAAHCQGRRMLNLFAYTGLFAIAALRAGAASACDVDLSAPALELARRNAAANDCGDRHRTVHADCLAYLTDSKDLVDLVICDPPTAARGGRGWVARRDYPRLLTALRPRLAPGALLVCCSNTVHGGRFDLTTVVDQAFPQAAALTPPELGSDIPQAKGFPEGRPYQIAIRVLPDR